MVAMPVVNILPMNEPLNFIAQRDLQETYIRLFEEPWAGLAAFLDQQERKVAISEMLACWRDAWVEKP